MNSSILKTSEEISIPQLFQQSNPAAALLVSVIVPVKNEAANLLKTLEALNLQQDGQGISLNKEIYEVLVLANNCSDQSYNLAKKFQQLHPEFRLYVAEKTFPKKIANIGTARGLLMDEAYRRLTSVGKSNGIIASTDGDSEVDPTWIYHIIEEIKKGNDAVGGQIITQYFGDQSCNYHTENEQYRNLVTRVESIADPLEHDPWPRHFQYFGANLALTCKVYKSVGGLPQLPFLEDEALHRALLRKDAKIRRSLNVKVITSNRKEGRVEIGFSQQLREWDNMKKMNEPQLVASADELIIKFTSRQCLRKCWLTFLNVRQCDENAVASIAENLHVNSDWLQQQIKTSIFFGDLWDNVESKMYAGQWVKIWKPVEISKAIKGLKAYIEKHLITEQI